MPLSNAPAEREVRKGIALRLSEKMNQVRFVVPGAELPTLVRDGGIPAE